VFSKACSSRLSSTTYLFAMAVSFVGDRIIPIHISKHG
jgi:hypothetical protein